MKAAEEANHVLQEAMENALEDCQRWVSEQLPAFQEQLLREQAGHRERGPQRLCQKVTCANMESQKWADVFTNST